MKKKFKINQRNVDLLKVIIEHFDREDRTVREAQISKWRNLKLMWDGIEANYENEVAHDWRTPRENNDEELEDDLYYDKPINVFRAYLETVFAALSITVPPITCFPDDADNVLDLETARAGDKIAELIFRHNNAVLVWLHALFIFGTEGLVAFHNYTKSSEKYGTYEDKEYDDAEEEHEIASCPSCGYQLDDNVVPPGGELNAEGITNPGSVIPPAIPPMASGLPQNIPPDMGATPMGSPNMGQPNEQNPIPGNQTSIGSPMGGIDDMMGGMPELDESIDEFDPEFIPLDMMGEGEICPGCGQMINPQMERKKFIVSRLVGVTQNPKTRICLEAYGGLHVKVPFYAKNQEECPYLNYDSEINWVNFVEEFPDWKKDKRYNTRSKPFTESVFNPTEAWGRLNAAYNSEYPRNNITKRQWWFRPSAFNILELEDEKHLRKQFPHGVKVTLGNDEVVEYHDEALDDHWTLNYNPLSDHLHHQPLGMLLVTVQEVTNDIISIALQTMEHGITQTFASRAVLNFNAYKKAKVRPGDIFPVQAQTGKPISDGFHDIKTAALSGEVLPLFQKMQELGQLASAALPSLFGGQLQGTNTASEYSMSRTQALQRLGNVWKMFLISWKEMFGKAIPAYMKELKEDEKYVKKDPHGNFVNEFIRKAELQGKIGAIEIEASENLPLSWSQKKDTIMNLLNAGNPAVLALINSPTNLPLIHKAIGLDDFHIPDENFVEKQNEEIQQLLTSEPIVEPMGMDPLGQPQEQEVPSVEIDPDIDNNAVEYQTIQFWASSTAGRLAKTENPKGYRNVLLHGKMHKMAMMQEIMQQQMAQSGPPTSPNADGGPKPPPAKANEKSKPTPVQGDGDVKTN